MIAWCATRDISERLHTALSILELQIERSCEQRRLRSLVRVGRSLVDAGDPERALRVLAEGTEFLARVPLPHGPRETETERLGRLAMLRLNRVPIR